jgi:hypothetical protein
MENDRTTPFGMWRYGNDFRQAAVAVLSHHNDRVFMPFYFLLGQSIELSLKAFLLGRKVKLSTLKSREYGHNLEKLLKEARRRKLGNEVKLLGVHCGVVKLLNYEYKDKRFQYIETGRILLPDAQFTLEAAELLSQGLQNFCYKATFD